MKCNRSIVGIWLLCGVGTLFLAGCGNRYVSRGEYLDTAMSRSGPGAAEIYGYVPPQETRAVDLTPGEPEYVSPPRVIVIDDGRHQDVDVSDRDNDDFDDVIVVSPTDRVTGSFRDFTSDVGRQLQVMDRDLAQLQARASIKGAAAEAAVESATRDLRMYRERVEAGMTDLRGVEDLSVFERQQAEIREWLRAARQSLERAEAEIDRIPAVD